MKKIISLLLCLTTCLGCVSMLPFASSAAASFAMPNFFADNMMFQRNKPMNLFGVAPAGKVITAELYETNDTIVPVERVNVTVPADGNWSLSFSAREGSYQHYRIVVYEGTTVMRIMHTVYVGELWIAAGQSNMEYRLDWEKDGAAEIANANDPYFRALLMVSNPVNGTPLSEPSFDIYGATWIDGTNKNFLGEVSANAYYASKVLREQLDMPVGIINASLGSTNIQTWLSRESIENNTLVKQSLQRNSLYFTAQEAAAKTSDFRDMCAMFNTKIGPLAGLNLAGVMWCQGESNRDGAPNNEGFYTEAIKALASGYSEIFGYEEGDMPVIVINIANHPYKGDAQNIPKWIEEIADAAKEHSNIVNIPIYDVPLTYKNPPDPSVAYSIHPNTKKPGGTRAGYAAFHNFCKEGAGDYYAPTVSAYEAKDGALYVTFDHAVKGLTTLNDSIGVHGFTVAGEDGLFLPAKAQIQGKNVVKVWHESIENPVNFTYAFNSYAQSANLCNSYSLPAVPFRSNRDMRRYFAANDWMYCEDTTVFINDGIGGDFQPTWHTADGNSTVTVDANVKYEGVGSIRLDYTANANPTAGVNFGYSLMTFNMKNYTTLSVMVKNKDARNKNLKLMVGKQGDDQRWLLPVAGRDSYAIQVLAGSDFTQYTFELRNLQGYNTTESASLTQINYMEVVIEDADAGTVYIDDINVSGGEIKADPFTSYTENLAPIYHVALSTADNTDPTWKDYNYIGQEFIPEKDAIEGISLPLHLSSGKATLHLEIRTSINTGAIAYTNVELTSKGNGVEWYDILFEKPVSVTPNQSHYFAFYLTERDSDSICIAYGRDLGMNQAVYYGYACPMEQGGPYNLTTVYNQLQFGFKLKETTLIFDDETNQKAADAVIALIDALPDTITLEHEEAVQKATEAYRALTLKQALLVTNSKKLIDAQQAIEELKKPLCGDVTGDRKVNAQDALEILKSIVGKITFTEEQTALADTYGDGKLDAKDALYVLRYAVQKEESLPYLPA